MSDSADKNESLKVLQFTDLHFFKDSAHKLLGVDTALSFADVYKAAMARFGVPDFYLLTGDLSQDESEESYRRLAQAMRDCGASCYFLPGNHDRRQEMSRGLIFEGSQFSAERRVIKGKWQIILLDTLVEGEVGGRLESSELEFLKDCLDERPDLHALITLHHHPVPMGARWLDQIGVENGAEFMALVKRYKSVKAVLWGHVHQEYEAKQDGITLLATPSTCVQFKVKTDDFGVDAVPPGFRWLELSPSGSVRTGVLRTERVALGLELSSAGY